MRRPRLVRLVVCLGVTFFFALPLHLSFAAPEPRKNFPCPDCLFYPPLDPAKPVPLLVVLHGDAPGGKKPLVERDSSPFVQEAVSRGIAVFAPRCPLDQGCKVGSFWQWTDGDPIVWFDKQIDIIRKDVTLDPDRIWIAGWSGGASFLGYRYPSLAGRYSAVVFAGGGMPPAAPSCPACSPPAYFMVGNKNPLHHLAKDLRKNVIACSSDVTWDLLPGQDHGGEWRTLHQSPKIKEIFDWLLQPKRKGSATCLAEQRALSSPPVAPNTIAVPAPSITPSAAPAPPKVSLPAHSACAFSASTNRDQQKSAIGILIVFLAMCLRCRRITRAIDAANQMETDPKTAS